MDSLQGTTPLLIVSHWLLCSVSFCNQRCIIDSSRWIASWKLIAQSEGISHWPDLMWVARELKLDWLVFSFHSFFSSEKTDSDKNISDQSILGTILVLFYLTIHRQRGWCDVVLNTFLSVLSAFTLGSCWVASIAFFQCHLRPKIYMDYMEYFSQAKFKS